MDVPLRVGGVPYLSSTLTELGQESCSPPPLSLSIPPEDYGRDMLSVIAPSTVRHSEANVVIIEQMLEPHSHRCLSARHPILSDPGAESAKPPEEARPDWTSVTSAKLLRGQIITSRGTIWPPSLFGPKAEFERYLLLLLVRLSRTLHDLFAILVLALYTVLHT